MTEISTARTAAQLLPILRRLQPIGTLSDARLMELAGFCAIETTERGGDPFRGRGAERQSVYLLGGELKLAFADGSFGVRVGGSEEAARPLAQRAQSIRSAKAITDVSLLRIDDDALDIAMTWDQLSAASSEQAKPAASPDWRAMSGAFHLHTLQRGALAKLPPASIERLLARFERVRQAAGEVVVREGEPGDYYYIIESGRCRVTRRVGGVDLELAELKSGEGFGEEALVAESTRNASVTMTHEGVLLRLGKADFVELLREPLLHRLSWDDALGRVAAGAQWLDVRYPSEYQYDHLPNARNLPLNEIRHAIGVLDRALEYVVYCQSGRRSSAAAFLLSQYGYRAFWLCDGIPRSTTPEGPVD